MSEGCIDWEPDGKSILCKMESEGKPGRFSESAKQSISLIQYHGGKAEIKPEGKTVLREK
jgi:hypothetical protein